VGKFAGKNLAVQLNDGSTLRLISTAVSQATTPDTTDTPDVTGGGATNKSYVVGLADQRVTLTGPLDDSANGQHAVMTGILHGTAGYELRVSPKGTASGNIQYKGTVLLSRYDVNTAVADAPRYTAEFVPFDNQIGMVWGTI
jgi:hypothetical protein